ncbi:hypothetical protein FIV42_29825 [Persicimonas caeni]|uniref:Uncharacterized protein n=1 Tax=Persicimonas caeni TaxID=2292766 RepID=A0A4Y6Q2I7_PERCE|nr:hypothetical protein [Persicimonas caeni]QDG54794.1 hypothetical protein FIV42_29825 [Persicimonas caeni]QED36015.1 hypothetical protein FRD00_29820 [Persicimonas caeni]
MLADVAALILLIMAAALLPSFSFVMIAAFLLGPALVHHYLGGGVGKAAGSLVLRGLMPCAVALIGLLLSDGSSSIPGLAVLDVVPAFALATVAGVVIDWFILSWRSLDALPEDS